MNTKPISISKENKRIAKYIANAFGGSPHVTEHGHDTENITVGVLWSKNTPEMGVTSYSTVRLSDYFMKYGEGEFNTRLEIAGCCYSGYENFSSIIASAAFCIMRTHNLCFPGFVMPNYVKEYEPDSPVPHLYFTSPFIWENELKTLDVGTKKVSWLLAIPISDAEYDFLERYGYESFENMLEEKEVDIFELYRTSSI